MTFDIPQDVHSVPSVAPCPKIYFCKSEGQHKSESEVRNDGRMGKPTKNEVTREGQRLQWFFLDRLAEGDEGKDIAERLSVSPAYITNVKGMGSNGRTGIGAEIVRRVKEQYGVHPDYFYEEYEGRKSYKLFPISAMRDEKRVRAVEQRLDAREEGEKQIELKLAKLDLEFTRLRQLLEKFDSTNTRKR